MRFGIDLGGSHVAIGLVNEYNEIVEKRTYYMNDRGNQLFENYILSSIVHGINEILDSTKYKLSQIEKIGIATPGNPQNGTIKNIVNLGIGELNLEKKLKNALGVNIDVKVGNDGKCAALAEKKYGSLKEYEDCIFLCIGTGIGGAAFINGHLLEPKRNPGFEIGHIIIKKDGEKCKCGNCGCFEVYCSKRKFKNQMQEILGINEYISAVELTKVIKDNISDVRVSRLLEEYIDNLSIGIANIINIFEPEAISIGGSMSHYEEVIIEKLREKINNGEHLFNKENVPKILTAQAGNNAGIIGATLI